MNYLQANEYMVKYCNKKLRKRSDNKSIRELKEIRKRSQTNINNIKLKPKTSFLDRLLFTQKNWGL